MARQETRGGGGEGSIASPRIDNPVVSEQKPSSKPWLDGLMPNMLEVPRLVRTVHSHRRPGGDRECLRARSEHRQGRHRTTPSPP